MQINSDGRLVRDHGYAMITAKDKSRKPGDVIPCGCEREGCTFVFDVSAARQKFKTEGCREYKKKANQRKRHAEKKEIARRYR